MDPNGENDQTPLEDDVPVYADRDDESPDADSAPDLATDSSDG